MILLIDGFNLIYKFPELEALMYESKLNLAREGLLKILNQYKVKRGNTVMHVFFDGKKIWEVKCVTMNMVESKSTLVMMSPLIFDKRIYKTRP